MGRLEKIVVLTVLTLVAAILFYSLRSDTSGGLDQASAKERTTPRNGKRPADGAAGRRNANGSAPVGVMSTSLGANAQLDAAAADAPPADPVGAPRADLAAPSGVDAGVAPTNGAATPQASPQQPTPQTPVQPAVSQPGSANPAVQPVQADAHAQYLVSRVGLSATASEEFMLYTWQAGDSYRSVAEKYYGSQAHAKRLRDANEGRDDAKLVAGDMILVSVKPTAAADRIARPSARDAQPTTTGVDGGTYTVAAGDVLGTISKRVYGSASKWRKIYDANRDVIGADPNQLKVGMVLRIPQ